MSDIPTRIYERMVDLVQKVAQILARPEEIRVRILTDVFHEKLNTRRFDMGNERPYVIKVVLKELLLTVSIIAEGVDHRVGKARFLTEVQCARNRIHHGVAALERRVGLRYAYLGIVEKPFPLFCVFIPCFRCSDHIDRKMKIVTAKSDLFADL